MINGFDESESVAAFEKDESESVEFEKDDIQATGFPTSHLSAQPPGQLCCHHYTWTQSS